MKVEKKQAEFLKVSSLSIETLELSEVSTNKKLVFYETTFCITGVFHQWNTSWNLRKNKVNPQDMGKEIWAIIDHCPAQ